MRPKSAARPETAEVGALCDTGRSEGGPLLKNPSYRVICVYCDDSWDREAVGKVFKVLVEDLNLVSGAYKASRSCPLRCFQRGRKLTRACETTVRRQHDTRDRLQAPERDPFVVVGQGKQAVFAVVTSCCPPITHAERRTPLLRSLTLAARFHDEGGD